VEFLAAVLRSSDDYLEVLLRVLALRAVKLIVPRLRKLQAKWVRSMPQAHLSLLGLKLQHRLGMLREEGAAHWPARAEALTDADQEVGERVAPLERRVQAPTGPEIHSIGSITEQEGEGPGQGLSCGDVELDMVPSSMPELGAQPCHGPQGALGDSSPELS